MYKINKELPCYVPDSRYFMSYQRKQRVPDRSSGQSSFLCQCNSGGVILPPPQPPPPCIPPVISGFPRGAQSLPSTPNANRRLISHSPRLDRTFRLDIGPERRMPDRSSGQSSLLCRCGSGGARLPPPQPPPPCLPPVISSFPSGAQSLPSKPNANRRLISHSPRLDRTFRLDIGPERRKQDHSIPGAPIQVPIPPPPPPAQVHDSEPCYQGYSASNTTMDCEGVGVSESTVLASGMGIDEDPNGNRSGPRRALNQVWSQQRRSFRYRTSSQPLMKVSSMVIGIIAALIIGFIVLSPLFHILLP